MEESVPVNGNSMQCAKPVRSCTNPNRSLLTAAAGRDLAISPNIPKFFCRSYHPSHLSRVLNSLLPRNDCGIPHPFARCAAGITTF